MNALMRLTLAGAIGLLCGCQAAVRPDRPTSPLPATTPAESTASVAQTTPIPTEPASEPDPVASEPPPESVENFPEPGTGEAVFARLRERLSPGACEAGGSAPRWRERYAHDPSAFARHLEKTLPLLDFVSAEVERQELPAEFALIPIVESWYRPEALGSGGPAGMWQMIGSTARNHGIRITPGYDGRLSPVESTRAALSYLDTLHPMFGDWRATVMAYNAGEYRLLSAFKRDGSREVSTEDRKPSGLSIITYDYVAKLQALSCLITEPERQELSLPLSARFTPLTAVLVDDEVLSLDQVAIDAGVSSAELRKLNPGYKSGRIVAGVPRSVLMPETSLASFLAERSAAPPTPPGEENSGDAIRATAATTAAPDRHQVRKGDTLSMLAERYRVSLRQLLQWNGLGAKSLLRPGQWLKLSP